jgi:phosphoadenosine phosphosulfate reductase
LDTGFHFPETLEFRDSIVNSLNLKLIILKSPLSKLNQIDENGRFYYCSNSDYCCHINKVLPLEPILQTHDVWVSGVRGDQSGQRQKMSKVMTGAFGVERYHPMIEWSSKDIWDYRKKHQLPSHPLEQKGYLSVGCSPCTTPYVDDTRSGRWSGQSKKECGLHTDLLNL